MNRKNRTTPPGTRDLLFEESAAAKRIETSVTQVFEAGGYQEVMTPGVEYYDMFTRKLCGIPQEQLYKLVGPDGRLLVLRPDSTLPIARMVSTRLKNAEMPLRLYYTQSVFRVSPAMSGNLDETVQSGIELIGLTGEVADIEVLTTAASALKALGLNNFRIEIGHAAFFKALVCDLQTDEDTKEAVRNCVESKNYSLLSQYLDDIEQNYAAIAIKKLPRLFGGAQIFNEALKLIGDNIQAKEALEYIVNIYNKLSDNGLADVVSVDLGLVHRNDYYTGLVFRGYIEGSGVTVLSGGRYDSLLGRFGADRPATGFVIENTALIPVILSSQEQQL